MSMEVIVMMWNGVWVRECVIFFLSFMGLVIFLGFGNVVKCKSDKKRTTKDEKIDCVRVLFGVGLSKFKHEF